MNFWDAPSVLIRYNHTMISKIFSKIEKTESGCWLWLGAKNGPGYGVIATASRPKQNFKYTHRIVYEEINGQIPSGMVICHKCDVRHCCNPEHLFVGTVLDNNTDCIKKGRRTKLTKEMSKVKLNKDMVEDIKNRRNKGAKIIDLAKEFGVNRATISKVITGKSWAK